MAVKEILTCVESRIETAQYEYGDYSSTHEALGVALEEWNEFQLAIQSNIQSDIMHEALDLAAVLVKLVENLEHGTTKERSGIEDVN